MLPQVSPEMGGVFTVLSMVSLYLPRSLIQDGGTIRLCFCMSTLPKMTLQCTVMNFSLNYYYNGTLLLLLLFCASSVLTLQPARQPGTLKPIAVLQLKAGGMSESTVN